MSSPPASVDSCSRSPPRLLACELLHDGQDGEGRARLEESMAADPSVWPLLPMMTSMGLKIVERYDEAGEVLDAATRGARAPHGPR